jgi:hypothetical protein
MARIGAKTCKAVLAGVMRDFGVSLADLQAKSRTEQICLAKEAFINRCAELRIQTIVMAETLGVTRSTVFLRRNPEKREQKRLRERKRRAGGKSELFSAVMGCW